jgi:hypothetical protein
MNIELIPEFVSLFNQYKQSNEYKSRQQQFVFAALAKEIILETLKNKPLKNEHLTGFIQMFKWETGDDTFDKYLLQNIADKKKHDEIYNKAYEIEEYGYTAAGKTAINKLTQEQLNEVQEFLQTAFLASTTEEAIKLIENYDALQIPEVKHGVYSPWLYYINPALFPIINNTHIDFLEWMDIEKDYAECIKAFFELKKEAHEEELGMIDGFCHQFVWYTVKYRFSKFIANYKKLLSQDKDQPEIYKWECVTHYQNNFNINAPDFERMLRSSLNKAKNLIYINSLGYILKAAKYFPEEVRTMFKDLYNEKKELQKRIEQFQQQAKNLLPNVIKKYGKSLNDQQDERTISFYLAMKYPEKYPLFKDDLYKVLIDIFPNKEPRKAGLKYLHYIELSKDVIPLIESDEKLIELSNSRLTSRSFTGDQKQLLFQDILWRNKIGTDVDEKIKYYLLGAYWEGDDQSTRFVENGIWENGYDDKFVEEIKTIKPGSRVAIKSVHTEAKVKSVMTIKAIGTVTKNHNDGKLLDVEWDIDFSPFKVDFSGGYWGTVHLLENVSHIEAIFFRKEDEKITKNMEIVTHNLILYGPPGTGKTYYSIDKAVELAMGKSLGNHEENKKQFDTLRTEGQIEFVTFHQNYTYEDFIVGIAPDVTSANLRFDKKEGVFKLLCDRAKINWLASINSRGVEGDFKSVFNSFFSKLIEEEIKEIEIPMKSKGYRFKITAIDIDDGRIKFTKQSGGTGHDLLIKNVKGIFEGSLDYGQEGLGVYYTPLVEKLKEHAINLQKTISEKASLKNYVLVIDEINRANISKVFGELITLLEDDKRLGKVNELKVTLANGEKEFGIPPNLHIIGTMNTADKSISLVDLALRRRFEFIGKYPIYTDYDNNAAELLKNINDAIYEERKSADYLVGHAYFMKDQTIKTVLETKVVPLLMEYFSGKTDVVSKIFFNTAWQVSYNKSTYSWDINLKE